MPLDRLTFYKRHLQSVRDDYLASLPRDARALRRIWNHLFQDEIIRDGGRLNDDEVGRLLVEFQRRIDGIMPVDVIAGAGCVVTCGFYFEPDASGEYHRIRVVGGFDMVRRRIADEYVTVIVDRATGDELELGRRDAR